MTGKLAARNALIRILALAAVIAIFEPSGWTQVSPGDRAQAQEMLKTVVSDVGQFYYDPKLLGTDWDARVRKAKEVIANATTVQAATLEIAAVLESLNDSHTYFLPPRYSILVDYGWEFQMLGDRCYVTHVKAGSDAEVKGLRPGDEVMMINGVMPTRENIWKMQYKLYLYPQYAPRVGLFDPSSKKIRKVDVAAKVWETQSVRNKIWDKHEDMFSTLGGEELRHGSRIHSQQIDPGLMILKIPEFNQTDLAIENLLDSASKHQALIMDLRGNPGGSVSVLKNWVRGVFPDDVKIADRVWRGKTEAEVAKGKPRHIFSGKLIVIVDSDSKSAAEHFARVVQIEKRGIVLGDRTSGMTMEGKLHVHPGRFTYGATVTRAELVMKDGKSLERLGVTPDETIIPVASDLANGRDPVLARAVELAGGTLSAEAAGKLFPYEWPKDWLYKY
jgi:carboxyl-terminal processing protease